MNYSPLRYPGGKSKLSPLVYLIMENTKNNCRTYIEPFAGGAGIALSLLLNNKVDKVVINDYDKAIYSFWRAIKFDTDKLVKMISDTPVTVEEWKKQRDIYRYNNRKYSIELAFSAFYLNRTNHSGILSAGPIGGLKQDGAYLIDARYNKKSLINKVLAIAEHKKNIYVYNKEIRSFISQVIPNYESDGFVYFDPPYYNKGKALYKNFFKPSDHVDIARAIMQQVNCDWIITYDDVLEIEALYQGYPIQKFILNYSVSQKSPKGSELLICKNDSYTPTVIQMKNLKIQLKEEVSYAEYH